MNPYDFVPYPNFVRRGEPIYRDTLKGNSGRLECELKALSPFLVMDPYERATPNEDECGRFMLSGLEDEEEFVIPGTTLKGMLRSVAEVLSDSCVVTTSNRARHLVPDAIAQCTTNTLLCSACRVFGFMKKRIVLKGPINIGQAKAVGEPQEGYQIQLIPLASPKPHHDAFYGHKDLPAGRKFYFHHRSVQTAFTKNELDRGNHIVPLKAGAAFTFTITFDNLSDADLDLLVASIVLKDDVRHKLGYGKPAGLGSVQVTIQQMILNGADRYRSFDSTPKVLESGSTELNERNSRGSGGLL